MFMCSGSLGCLLVWQANGASGDRSISVLWVWWEKPTAATLLTVLILPLSVDMDQETVSLSVAFCLTICNINKNPHSSTLRPDRFHTQHHPQPALNLDMSYCAWGLIDLGLVRQINICLCSSLCPYENGLSLAQKLCCF